MSKLPYRDPMRDDGPDLVVEDVMLDLKRRLVQQV